MTSTESKSLLALGALQAEIVDVAGGTVTAAAELHLQIRNREKLFERAGIRQGHRVALDARTSASFFVDLFALHASGAFPFLVDPGLISAERERLLKRISPHWIITDSNEMPVAALPAERAPLPADTAMVLFTSGTSATPKAVIHRFSNLKARIAAGANAIPRTERETTLSVLPLHLAHGLISVCLQTLFDGSRLVLAPVVKLDNAELIGRLVDEHRVTFLSGTPATWGIVVRMSHPPQSKSLVRTNIASARASQALAQEIRNWSGTDVFNSYGLTESASWVSDSKFEFSNGSSDNSIGDGKAWGTEFKIQNPDSNGVGELFLRSKSLFAGYWDMGTPASGEIEWYGTGDIARKTAEGEIRLAGRLGRVINRGGLKISPEEIELEIEASGLVKDVVVSGVSRSEMEGCTADIAALVVLERETEKAEFVRRAETYLRSKLSPQKIPGIWMTVENIPRRPNGKPDLIQIGSLWKQK